MATVSRGMKRMVWEEKHALKLCRQYQQLYPNVVVSDVCVVGRSAEITGHEVNRPDSPVTVLCYMKRGAWNWDKEIHDFFKHAHTVLQIRRQVEKGKS